MCFWYIFKFYLLILDIVKNCNEFQDSSILYLLEQIREMIVCFGKITNLLGKKLSKEYSTTLYKNLKFLELIKGFIIYYFYILLELNLYNLSSFLI